MEEISHTRWTASYATDGSLTRSNGLFAAPEEKVMPGRNPGGPHVAPPSPDRTNPMSVAPPLKNRPTWKVPTTVLPNAKVSGSTSVACWLVGLVNGSELTRVRGTFACAGAAPRSAATATTTTPIPALRKLDPRILIAVTYALASLTPMTSARSVISGRVLAKAFGHERLGRYAAPRAACYRSQELLAAKRERMQLVDGDDGRGPRDIAEPRD